MKTIKQIADELGIDKQKVYRYIKKNCINESYQKSGVMYYDEAVESRIKQAFSENKAHHDVLQNHINDAVIDVLLKQSEILQKELDSKNEQIAQLQKLLDQEQKLHAMTEQKLLQIQQQEKELQKEEEAPISAEEDKSYLLDPEEETSQNDSLKRIINNWWNNLRDNLFI